MRLELPVIWMLHGLTSSGRLDVAGERLTLTSGGRAFSFPLDSVASLSIERGPAQRLRGLPALALCLKEGETVHVASLGGSGSLHELAAVVGGVSSR